VDRITLSRGIARITLSRGIARRHRRHVVTIALVMTVALGAAVPASSALAGHARNVAQSGPALSVDATGPGSHAISPDIYGMNFVGAPLGTQLAVPVDRWGGNSTDTYNWKIGAANTGADWYFENVSDCWTSTYSWCSGETTNTVRAYRIQIARDRTLGATTLLNLPLVGYVAGNAPVAQPLTCGYPKSQYPTQDSFDSYDPSCGNGRTGGAVIPGTPANDGIAAGTAFDRQWVASLVKQYGTAAQGGVGIYELGNEPSLWGETHRDVHPQPETAAELASKSRAMATAVKQTDPSAQVLGFSEWGWPGYFCTEADTWGSGCDARTCTTSPDCANHGHLPMAEWYLNQFAAYDAQTRVRHLDYFDVHYYAQGGTSPDVTRSLWDPTYTDPSWINDKIALIPRMHCWIDGHVLGLCPTSNGYYPGTKIALSEYNLSLSEVSAQVNAIIEGDTLGIFARGGVSLATRWGMSYDGNEIQDAFLMYRNYDGAGGRFGDTWIDATSANQSRLSVYGAHRSSDGAYTIMVINKTTASLTSPLTLSGGISGSISTWQWAGATITSVPGTSIVNGVITATYRPMSMTLYVVK
jgi:Glycoside hydrolase family 44